MPSRRVAYTVPGYTGGKNARSPQGTGRWIASMLPHAELYCEPFLGMGGVLLQRSPSKHEIANDLDGRVVNWWRTVRDQPDELQRLIGLTPKARAEHEWAMRAVGDESETPVRRALAFTIIAQSAMARQGAYAPRFAGPQKDWRAGMDTGLVALAERIRNVELENRDACDLLERCARERDAVIYVDPPYAGTVGYEGAYQHIDDRERLRDVLLEQRGKVAVSGYGTEWDDLGWKRAERSVKTHVGNALAASGGAGAYRGAVDELHDAPRPSPLRTCPDDNWQIADCSRKMAESVHVSDYEGGHDAPAPRQLHPYRGAG